MTRHCWFLLHQFRKPRHGWKLQRDVKPLTQITKAPHEKDTVSEGCENKKKISAVQCIRAVQEENKTVSLKLHSGDHSSTDLDRFGGIVKIVWSNRSKWKVVKPSAPTHTRRSAHARLIGKLSRRLRTIGQKTPESAREETKKRSAKSRRPTYRRRRRRR